MKTNNLIKHGAVILITLFIISCDKWIDPAINENPDEISDVPYNLLLPAIEVDLSYNIGGFLISTVPAMWMQYLYGQERQAATIGKNYLITETDVEGSWEIFYTESLMDMSIYIEKTGDANRQARGVGKVLMALGLGHITDLWGDIPYSEAFKGNNDLNPAYDSQESIYNTIKILLTEAIEDLSTPDSENEITLGTWSNDLIYDGAPEKWIAAAHSLRARYAIHLSKKGTVDYSAVLSDCSAGISGNENDLQMPFGDNESNANPRYQYDVQRGDVSPSLSFDAFASGDPRLEVFADGPGNFGSFYGMMNSPVPLMTYVETKFIEAEAYLRREPPSRALANNAYDAAVTASLEKFGIDDPSWLTDNTSGALGDISLQNIIEAKYIALFLQLEAYNDYRRTGWPVLNPTAGNAIPSRFPYCANERLYNTENVPAGLSLNSPVWWAN